MDKRFRKEKNRAEIEFLRARMWSINYFDLRHVLQEKHNKILEAAGKEYVRRLKEQEEDFQRRLAEREKQLREEPSKK